MKCPICDIEMRLSIREEIEIDYCPQCRGVWLDRGELEKIIAQIVIQYSSERETEKKQEQEAHVQYETQRLQNGHNDDDSRNEQKDRYEKNEGGGQKREGFFSNLMELFGGD
jgi:Zn-finger nucleic acid-binding protein